MSEIRRITVVGAGQMGAGIAQTAAVGGFDVTLSDVAPRQLEQAVSGIEASLAKLTEKGRLDEATRDATVCAASCTRRPTTRWGSGRLARINQPTCRHDRTRSTA